MFGFMCPEFEQPIYRSIYARCCQWHRSFNGTIAAIVHSYEAVFIYACAYDAGLCGNLKLGERSCCRLQTIKKPLIEPDFAIGQFSSKFAMLLAGVKLDDNVRDDRTLLSRVGRFLLAGRIGQSRDYFQELGVLSRIEEQIERHLRFEELGSFVALNEYADPTAKCFSLMLGTIPATVERCDLSDAFSQIGYRLGAALIAFDCAMDWEQDCREGLFNPATDLLSAEKAIKISSDNLLELSELCSEFFGKNAISSMIAKGVRDRVMRCKQQIAEGSSRPRVSFLATARRATSIALALSRDGLFPRTNALYCIDPVSVSCWGAIGAGMCGKRLCEEDAVRSKSGCGSCCDEACPGTKCC